MTTREIARSTTDDRTASLRRGRSAALALAVGATALVGGIAAAPAGAAEAGYVHTWERVASCESGNNWHINTGNGYYGGLQFSSSTWSAYHGHKYAPEANMATKAEQIQVARRVLDAQGPNAWPVCGPRGGLTRSSGGATSAPLPDDAASASSRSAKRHHRHHRHHAARHHARHAHHAHYTVRSGDTLSKIARKKHIAGGWHALYRANKKRLHHNPNRIHVGQVLRLP